MHKEAIKPGIALVEAACLLLLLCTAQARTLKAVATSTAYSDGGTATSVSQSIGDAEVLTAAVATNGGDATALQSADSGKHTQVVVADGSNTQHTSTASSPLLAPASWSDVPACTATPNSVNSVRDGNGRLWGYENDASCAYKDTSDRPLFYWEAAPACPSTPSSANSVTDSEGRLWGWAYGVSCAYKPSFHRKLTTSGLWSSSWGGWGSGLTSFWQHLAPFKPETPRQRESQAPASTSNDAAEQSQPSQDAGSSTAGGEGSEVQDAVVPAPSPTPRLHGTGNDTLDNEIRAESHAQAAADGSARAVAASAAASAAATADAANNDTQVISHAEAHAQSNASSWSWSPETGNVTHEAHAEAHAVADSANGTAKASAYATASTDGSDVAAQSDAKAANAEGAGIAYTQAEAGSRTLKANEFAAPIDVPLSSVPFRATNKAAKNTAGNPIGPSHTNPSEPQLTSLQAAVPDVPTATPPITSPTVPIINVTVPVSNITPEMVNVTVQPPSKPLQTKDPDLPESPAPVSPSPGSSQSVNRPDTPTARDTVPLTATNTHTLTIGTAVHTNRPAAVTTPPTVSGAGAVTDCQLVSMEGGEQAIKCSKPMSGPAANRVVPINISAGADSPSFSAAEGPEDSADAAMPAATPATATPSPAAGPDKPMPSSASPSATPPAASPDALLPSPTSPVVSPAVGPSPANAVKGSPVTPVIKRTITIIHDPALTDSKDATNSSAVVNVTEEVPTATESVNSPNPTDATQTAANSLTGPAPIPPSSTSSQQTLSSSPTPILRPSGYSLADYYDSDHTNDDLSQDLPPQIPGDTISSSPDTTQPVVSNASASPAVAPMASAAANSTASADTAAALGPEPTADQPATGAYSPAGNEPADKTVGTSDVNAAQPADTSAAQSSAAATQSAWQLSASPVQTPSPYPSPAVDPATSSPWQQSASPAPTPIPVAASKTPSAWQQPASPEPTPVAAPTENIVDTSARNLFGNTWQSAPPCQAQPNKRNSVQDATGRLWWWEDNRSCAYKSADGKPTYYDGYVEVKWETSPACGFAPTQINAMSDASGRAWGWIADTSTNCKFVKNGDSNMAMMYNDIGSQQ